MSSHPTAAPKRSDRDVEHMALVHNDVETDETDDRRAPRVLGTTCAASDASAASAGRLGHREIPPSARVGHLVGEHPARPGLRGRRGFDRDHRVEVCVGSVEGGEPDHAASVFCAAVGRWGGVGTPLVGQDGRINASPS